MPRRLRARTIKGENGERVYDFEVFNHPKFKKLIKLLKDKDLNPRLVCGLAKRGWTSHDIDIKVKEVEVFKVPLNLLFMEFSGGRMLRVSIMPRHPPECEKHSIEL